MSQGQRSAYSVVQVWRVGADRYYLLDQFRERCEFSDLLNIIRRFRRTYKPVAILIERATNGPALISQLLRRHPKIGKIVVPIDPDGRSKSARLRVHAKTIIAKRIHLPADVDWRDEFVAEFVEFPYGDFTDQVDATTQFLDHADELKDLKPSSSEVLAVVLLNSTGRSERISSAPGGDRGTIAVMRNSDRGPLTGRVLDWPFQGRNVTVRR